MDALSLLGAAIAILAILFGQILEGGQVASLLNLPALVIVFGGSFGAVVLQTPAAVLKRGLRLFHWIFIPPSLNFSQALKRIMYWASVARRDGVLGIEQIIGHEHEAIVRKGLQLLVDGKEPHYIRNAMEMEIYAAERYDMAAARMYESMGGYAPTLGIIGAVMGLILVMENLSDPERLGAGIATAFVATIYGIGLANLFLLPIANKLKTLIEHQATLREMYMEGIVGISEGDNPRNIELKLRGLTK
ncbi:MAG: flagellar motor protein [Gammaproteobacteria bacterium]|nr:flagellar motor protein [Gammaproteobacteria bacterium]MDH5730190.1 flagellar motor protein [Gammaproteobacteria bacterium]